MAYSSSRVASVNSATYSPLPLLGGSETSRSSLSYDNRGNGNGNASSTINSDVSATIFENRLLRLSEEPRTPTQEVLDVVQFAAPIFYASAAEGVLVADVVRLGNNNGMCTVSYHTVDGWGAAGSCYMPQTGAIKFQHGEERKKIEISIMSPGDFHSGLDFSLVLTNPVGCILGSQLHGSRAKVLDDCAFPSEDYQAATDNGSGISLFVDLFRLVFHSEDHARRSLAALALDQASNLYLYFSLWILVYLVDVVFSTTEESREELLVEGRELTAMLVGGFYVLPAIAAHVCADFRASLGVRSKVRAFLRKHVFRKYLTCSTQSRSELDADSHVTTITRAVDSVANSYSLVLRLVHCLARGLVILVFLGSENPMSLAPAFIMPLVIGALALCRVSAARAASANAETASAAMLRAVNETCANFALITDYHQQPRMVSIFEGASAEAEAANDALEVSEARGAALGQLLGPMLIGVCIALQAGAVLDGTLSLGAFVATLFALRECMDVCVEALQGGTAIAVSFEALQRLTQAMNLPSDLAAKAVASQRCAALAQELKASIETQLRSGPGNSASEADDDEFDTDKSVWVDHLEISLSSAEVSYGRKQVLRKLDLAEPQGSIVAVCGVNGSGKATVLRLLAGNLMPSSGTVFLPPHCRALYVPERVTLMKASAWDNITFGAPGASKSRVLSILSALGMRNTLIAVREELRDGKMQESADDHSYFGQAVEAPTESETPSTLRSVRWLDTLSHAELAKVQVARALIANPEVLLLQRPLQHHSDSYAEVLQALLKHISNRGCGLPEETVMNRRPRTLFFTPSSQTELRYATSIWTINERTKHMTKMSLSDLTEKDLKKFGLVVK